MLTTADRTRVATSDLDNSLRLWDAESGGELYHFEEIHGVSLNMDGTYLATRGNADTTIHVRQLASNSIIARLTYKGSLGRFTLGPQAKFLAADVASESREIWLWDVASEALLARLSPPKDIPAGVNPAYYKLPPFISLAFSPDGALLCAGRMDEKVYIWNVTTQELIGQMASNQPQAPGLCRFSPDGRRLATTHIAEKVMRIWDLPSFANPVQQITWGDKDRPSAYPVLSRNGRLAFGTGRSIQVWDLETGTLLFDFPHQKRTLFLDDISFSADDQYLAAAGDGMIVRIWDLTSGHELMRLPHLDQVMQVSFASPGRVLLTREAGGITRGWDTATGVEKFRLAHGGRFDGVVYNQSGGYVADRVGSLIRVWQAQAAKKVAEFTHDDKVEILALSSGGWRLATVTDATQVVHVWDVAAGKELYQLAHEDIVSSVIFSADDTLIVTGGRDHTARVWDSATGKQLTHFTHSETVKRVTLSADNIYLAVTTEVSSSGEDIYVWHLPTKRQVARLPHDGKRVEDMSFQSGHRVLASTDGGSTVRLWDPQSARIESLRLVHKDTVFDTAISSGSKRLIVPIDRKKLDYVPVWDLSTGEERFRIVHEDAVHDAAFSSDGQWLATASRDKTARVWNAFDGSEILRLPHPNNVHTVKFSADGHRLATFLGGIITGRYADDEEDLLQVWEVPGGQPTKLKIQGYINAFAFAPDGEQLATAEGEYETPNLGRAKALGFFGVRLWSITSGQELLQFPHPNPVRFLAFSPDGRRIATYSYGTPIRFWNVKTGTLVQEMAAPDEGDRNRQIVLSHDWSLLARRTDRRNNEVQIWEVATEKHIASLTHDGDVGDLVFSPDGRYLATQARSGQNEMVWVWDWMQGRPLVQLNPGNNIYDLRFTPDGSRVVTGGGDKTVRLWLWRADDLIADACARLERNLTREEWRTFLGDEPYDDDKRTCPNLPVPGK